MKFNKKLFVWLLCGGILVASAIVIPVCVVSCSNNNNEGKQVANLKYTNATPSAVDSSKAFGVSLSPKDVNVKLNEPTSWEYSNNGTDWKTFDNVNYKVEKASQSKQSKLGNKFKLIDDIKVINNNTQIPSITISGFLSNQFVNTQFPIQLKANGIDWTQTSLNWYYDDGSGFKLFTPDVFEVIPINGHSDCWTIEVKKAGTFNIKVDAVKNQNVIASGIVENIVVRPPVDLIVNGLNTNNKINTPIDVNLALPTDANLPEGTNLDMGYIEWYYDDGSGFKPLTNDIATVKSNGNNSSWTLTFHKEGSFKIKVSAVDDSVAYASATINDIKVGMNVDNIVYYDYLVTITNQSTTQNLTTYIRAKFNNDFSNMLEVIVNPSQSSL